MINGARTEEIEPKPKIVPDDMVFNLTG